MDQPTAFPYSPPKPLHPLSPERVNGKGSFSSDRGVSPSPSLPEIKGLKTHSRSGSDVHVQAMVNRFNTLDVKDYRETHKRDEAALKRAELAREMAERETMKVMEDKADIEKVAYKYREEARRLRKEVEEGRDRERKVAKRLDVVMDELHRSKETNEHAQGVYEKEIRRSRKEAFKSSSALVKLQEELKACRTSLQATRQNLDAERSKLSKREQETFSAQYAMVGLQEELDKMKENFMILEEERDALKTSLKEEEVARIAAEGGIALPVSTNDDDDELLASPRKSPRKATTTSFENKENMAPRSAIELKSLQDELLFEQSRRKNLEEQVDFMKMECQFQICSCRIAELKNASYVHDDSLSSEIDRIKSEMVEVIHEESCTLQHEEMEGVTSQDSQEFKSVKEEPAPVEEPEMVFSPTTGTFRSVPSTKPQSHDTQSNDEVEGDVMDHEYDHDQDEMRVEEDEAADAEEATQPPPRPIPRYLARITEASIESSPVAPPPTEVNTPREDTPPSPTPSSRASVHAIDDNEQAIVSDEEEEEEDEEEDAEQSPTVEEPLQEPQTPLIATRTITTTTTIPLQFSPLPPKEFPSTPSTIAHLPSHTRSFSATTPATASKVFSQSQRVVSQHAVPDASAEAPDFMDRDAFVKSVAIDREAALEAIRQRRGRTRSVAMKQATPRKQMIERRDISAPALKTR